MASTAESGSVKGPLISGVATIVSALIGAGASILVAFTTGHLTTPNDTREFQKAKQENTRLLQENEGLKEENAGLRQENTGLKHQNTSLHEKLAQNSTSPTPQPQDAPTTEGKTEVDNFVSQLDECKKSVGAATCVVRIINTKYDRVVRLYNDWTSMVDSTGNEQKAKVVSIGASTNPYPGMFAETTLPTNVPVKATVSFGGIDSDVNHLSILTLSIQPLVNDGTRLVLDGTREKEQIQFRNISLH